MINCVVVFGGQVTRGFMTTHTSSCSDPAWNLVRPRSWYWKIHLKLRNSRRNCSFVHFSVRLNWIALLSVDLCLSQQQKVC